MRIVIAIAATAGFLALPVGAAQADPPSCNWGELTSSAIAEGFAQGEHASTQMNPRVGLANVVEQGNLNATCELLS